MIEKKILRKCIPEWNRIKNAFKIMKTVFALSCYIQAYIYFAIWEEKQGLLVNVMIY